MSNAAFHLGVGSRRRRSLIAFAVVVLLLGAVASSASAQPAHTNYAVAGNIPTSGSAPQALQGPRGLAVDQSTGDILIIDSPRVAVFSPEAGPSAAYLTEFGRGVLSEPVAIAIDPSSGDVYVSDLAAQRIYRFKSDGAPVPTYTLDPTFTSPAQGSAAGHVGGLAEPVIGSFETSTLAVDPQTHDLLVADAANARIVRLGATGAFLGSFNGSDGQAGPLSDPYDIAVGSTGTIYVTDRTGGFLGFLLGEPMRVDRFQSDGTSLGSIGSFPYATELAVNQETGLVTVGSSDSYGGQVRLSTLIGDEVVNEALGSQPEDSLEDLALAAGPTGRLYSLGSNFSGVVTIDVFNPALGPGVALSAPSAVTVGGVRLQGTVDAGGVETRPDFELSTDGGASWTARPQLPALSGSGEVGIHEDVTGLEPNTEYLVRLTAANAETSTTSRPLSFTTATAPPAVVTLPVNDRTATSAVLDGRVNPYGLQTSYHIEYGSSTSYGQRLPLHSEQVAGKGHTPVFASVRLTGLTPGATYHYRILATSSAGAGAGEDVSFTTPAAGEGFPARVYEQVTPVDKHGAVVNSFAGMQAAADGNGLVYDAKNPSTAPESQSAPIEVRYLDERGADGWKQYALDAPQLPTQLAFDVTFVLGVSKDLSHELLASNEKLAAGGVEGLGNYYLRDTVTGEYKFLRTVSHNAYLEITQNSSAHYVIAGNSDYSRVVAFAEGAPEEFSDAGAHPFITRLPNGSAVQTYYLQIASDFSHFAFSAEGVGVYVSVAGHTTPISLSQRPGDDPTVVHPGTLLGATPDGLYYFFASADQLTTDAPEGGGVYRYDFQGGGLAYVGSGEYQAASANGEAVLSRSYNSLDVWRDGHTQSVLALNNPEDLNWSFSPNGEYLEFSSSEQLTSYDNDNSVGCASIGAEPTGGRCPEAYLYDVGAATLTCISCPSDGSRSTRGLGLGALDDQGRVFFGTTNALVPEDANGTEDVYEYRGGEDHLISPGTRGATAHLLASGADGRDVFFSTEESLVAQDTDPEVDIYDARVGGGIASQNVDSTPPPQCSAGQCPASLGGGGSDPLVASIEFVGAGAPAGPTSKAVPAKVRVTRQTVRGSTFTLSVKVPGKGRITGGGAGLVRIRKSVAKGGTYELKLSLTSAMRRKLARAGKLKLKVDVSFLPASGAGSAAVVSVSLGKGTASAKRAARQGGRAGR